MFGINQTTHSSARMSTRVDVQDNDSKEVAVVEAGAPAGEAPPGSSAGADHEQAADLAHAPDFDFADDEENEDEDDEDEDVRESMVELGKLALKEGRISEAEFHELEIIEERFINVKRHLLALAIELENHTMSKNAFAGAVASLAVITHLYEEFKGTNDVRIVTGYFTSSNTNHKYVVPHMWVETYHRRASQLWNKMFSDSDPKSTWSTEKQWGEDKITRMTDICGGTKHLRDAIILGQGVSFSKDSQPLRYYRKRPVDDKTGKEVPYPPGRTEKMIQAERNNKSIRDNPGGWLRMLGSVYPSGPEIFTKAIQDSIVNDPRQLRLQKSRDEVKEFYEEVGKTHGEAETSRQKEELLELGLPEDVVNRIASGKGTQKDFYTKADAEAAAQGEQPPDVVQAQKQG